MSELVGYPETACGDLRSGGGIIKWLDTANVVHDWRAAQSSVAIRVGFDGALYYASIGDGIIYRVQFQ